MKCTFVVLAVCFSSVLICAQDGSTKKQREKFPSHFAFQLRGLAPNKFSEPRLNSISNDAISTSIFQRNGFSFGGIIRQRYARQFGMEIGLNLSKRYYDLTMEVPDSSLFFEKDFAFTSFELPFNGLVFVQLSENIYSNAGLGMSLIYKPSNVAVNFQEGKNLIELYGIVYRKFNFNLNAQLGFEYVSRKSGTFYLGTSAHIPITTFFTYTTRYSHAHSSYSTLLKANIRAPFFTLDLRYYFPTILNKGVQPLKGPIE